MFISHVIPRESQPGTFVQMCFLCTDDPDSDVFQIEFQPSSTLSRSDVEALENASRAVALPVPIPVESERQIPWLDPENRVWLIDRENPADDPHPRYVGLLLI